MIQTIISAGQRQVDAFCKEYPTIKSRILPTISMLATSEMAVRVFVDIATGNAANFSLHLAGTVLFGMLSAKILPYSPQLGGITFIFYACLNTNDTFLGRSTVFVLEKIVVPTFEKIYDVVGAIFEKLIFPVANVALTLIGQMVTLNPVWSAVIFIIAIAAIYHAVRIAREGSVAASGVMPAMSSPAVLYVPAGTPGLVAAVPTAPLAPGAQGDLSPIGPDAPSAPSAPPGDDA